MNEHRCYIYKCVVDDGGAPCIDDGLLSLTICKPYIRSTASKGDLIFAFGGNSETPANRLVYIAEVSEQLKGGAYFEHPVYSHRSDSIYQRVVGGRLRRRRNVKFHPYPGARESDLGESPHYPKANALIAEDFRYFGDAGTDRWKTTAPRLKAMVEALGQGHRVNLVPELKDELRELKERIWREFPAERILGMPLHRPEKGCVRDCGGDIIVSGSQRRSC